MHELLEICKIILIIIEKFFVVYLVVYSSFLFFSAIIGSITLYKKRYDNLMHNNIKHKYNLPVIDLYSVSKQFSKIKRTDDVHFTDEGYKILANTIIKELK